MLRTTVDLRSLTAAVAVKVERCDARNVKSWRHILTTAAFVTFLTGLALVLAARDHVAAAIASAPNGDCYFDQSCDLLPGVVLGQHLVRVGWVLVGTTAVFATTATLARSRPSARRSEL
ncbi:hypothetical protein GCM10009593_38640 [Microlunatus antarcticus]